MTENNEEKTQKRKLFRWKKDAPHNNEFLTGFIPNEWNQAIAKRCIQRYWVVGVFMAISVFVNTAIADEWATESVIAATVILIPSLILLIGIYYKARWAAIIFLALYLMLFIDNIRVNLGSLETLFILIIPIYISILIFFQGTMAIIKWPKLKDEQEKTV